MSHTDMLRVQRAGLVLLMMAAAGCGARRPVLYPNEQYNKVGEATAQRDIDDCLHRADQYVSSGSSGAQNSQVAKDVGGRTAVGAGIGAASGAVGGAIG